MSLAAIQDNLVKTSLVQQTQTRSDDVGRAQEIAHVALQREHDRREDQVVISAQQKNEHGIRSDEERRKEEERRRRKKDGGAQGDSPETDPAADPSNPDSPAPLAGDRTVMRRINVVI
jgi:hypothetical protein